MCFDRFNGGNTEPYLNPNNIYLIRRRPEDENGYQIRKTIYFFSIEVEEWRWVQMNKS